MSPKLWLQRWWQSALILMLFLVAGLSWRFWLYQQHLQTPLLLNDPVVLMVETGSPFTRVLRQLQQAGIIDNSDLAHYVRWNKLANTIRAGEYKLVPGMTPLSFLQMLLEGRVVIHQVRIGEGWTLREAIVALQADEAIKSTLPVDDKSALQLALQTEHYPEGAIFPDTYNFERGTTDLNILLRAKAAMDKVLASAWLERDPGLPYQSPMEVLTMASIVEKETGQTAEQPQISGVFVRRLQMGMKLQTDPTVIYGIGPEFDGNLTRKHLETDTEYNSYTRTGLPPTPIALPSRNAILASVHPLAGKELYFVAKGDGTHFFSATLAEHNAAIKRYQLKQK